VALGWDPVKNPVNIAVRELQSCDAVTGCCIVFISQMHCYSCIVAAVVRIDQLTKS
jgi:hypothetical protein